MFARAFVWLLVCRFGCVVLLRYIVRLFVRSLVCVFVWLFCLSGCSVNWIVLLCVGLFCIVFFCVLYCVCSVLFRVVFGLISHGVLCFVLCCFVLFCAALS